MSCLGHAKITVSPGGRQVADKDHAWTLNNLTGVSPGPGLLFSATMGYRIIRDEREGYGPWRVTTLEYTYRLCHNGEDLFRLHWHPRGNSPVKYPHLHLALGAGALKSVDALKMHLRTERATLEQAVSWTVEVAMRLGAQPAREDWQEVLEASERPHLEHRSWGLFGEDIPALRGGV